MKYYDKILEHLGPLMMIIGACSLLYILLISLLKLK